MKANLVFFKESGQRRDITLPEGRTVVGREKGCDLRIPLPSVSRKHCAFTLEDETLRVEDLGSSNGTYRNGEELKEPAEVEAGDQVAVGSLIFTVQLDGDPSHVEPPLLEAPRHEEKTEATPDSSDSSIMTGLGPATADENEGSSVMTGVGPSSGGGGSQAAGAGGEDEEEDIADLIRRATESMDDDSGLDFDLDLDEDNKS